MAGVEALRREIVKGLRARGKPGGDPGLQKYVGSPVPALGLSTPADRQVVRPVRDFAGPRSDSVSKIDDHSSGERRVFNASFSDFRRVDESREDVRDIVYPTIVRVT